MTGYIMVPVGIVLGYHFDYQEMMQRGGGLAFLLQEKIKTFYDHNGKLIAQTLQERDNIIKTYLVVENNKVVMEQKTKLFNANGTARESEMQPRIREGYTYEQYEKAWNEFNQRELKLHKVI